VVRIDPRRFLLFTLAGIRKFHDWTHASFTLLLDHLSTIPAGEYSKEVPGFGFPTLRAQVLHILNCEGFWVQTLQALHFENEDPANWPTVSDARVLQGEVSLKTLNYLSGLNEQRLNAGTELHFSDGDSAVRTPALVLHHVLTHAFHHKGQIVSMCRHLGYPAPDTDLNQLE
jgi:uncharacterized damage-inducible protein DinB